MRRVVINSLCITSSLLLSATIMLPTTVAGPFRNPLRSRTSVEDLAEKIDKLERSLQYYGRVTAKAPDVWGQARLTAHRQEFENAMAARIGDFGNTLQGEISISDQAFLSEALAIAASARARTNDPTPVTGPTIAISNAAGLLPPVTTGDATTPAGPNDSTVTAQVISRTQPTQGLRFATAIQGNPPFSLEPEILLDQRKRFLDHLHEIRRINEGDDTVDAPGYSLNLVRIPISVIPGDKTRENYGAEVTVTAESHVTEELLPTTFRELVINDLIDQLALPIVKILDLTWDEHVKCEKLRAFADERSYQLRRSEEKRHEYNAALTKGAVTQSVLDEELSRVLKSVGLSNTKLERDGNKGADWRTDLTMNWKERLGGALQKVRSDNANQNPPKVQDRHVEVDRAFGIIVDLLEDERQGAINEVNFILQKAISLGKIAHRVQSPRERRSRYPIPATQIGNVFGEREFIELTVAVFGARDRFQCRDEVHLSDVQGFLRNELEHAYDFLGSTTDGFGLLPPPGPGGMIIGGGLWHSPNAPTANEIRQPNFVIPKRKSFFSNLPINTAGVSTHPTHELTPTHHRNHAENATESLAWAVLVESVLLNEKLNEDLQHVSRDPNCHCVPAGQQFCFYGPQPDPTAKQAFAEYVKCRWPIRVFALDPVTQQQNIADTLSLRREMQVALALSFQQRLVSAQSLTRYMRRVEQDMRTISLNNTVVGFSSGDDTFGWRFFPRMQTPDIESNLTVIGRDLIIGGPNRDARLKQWRIEPGMRECMALVVMPSFIKHVRFDVRTDWFPLVPCHITKKLHFGVAPPSMEKTVEWSKLIKSMDDSVMCCMQDQHLYRDGEVERLLKRSHQLSRELPLNTMYAQVPYENTLGGFEMFSSGVTDLAPELVGFYGAPGINPDADTDLFLVGKNFSVTGSQILAGNVKIEQDLMSRQVMRVTIPKGVQIVKRQCSPRKDASGCAPDDCSDDYVEIRLATPYGVSSSLLVPLKPKPVAAQPPPLPPTAQLQLPKELQKAGVDYRIRYINTVDVNNKLVVADADIRARAPHRLELTIPDNWPVPVSDAKLEIRLNTIKQDVSLDAKSAEYLPAGFAILTVPLKLRSEVKGEVGYMIEGANFGTLQVNLKNAVIAYLNENPQLALGPNNIKLTASLGATVIVDNHTRIPTGADLGLPIIISKKQ